MQYMNYMCNHTKLYLHYSYCLIKCVTL